MHKNWLSYWKDSLIDSQRLQIDFEREIHFVVKEFELASAVVPADKIEILFLDQEKRINKKNYSKKMRGGGVLFRRI